jgi:hypothetical protein
VGRAGEGGMAQLQEVGKGEQASQGRGSNPEGWEGWGSNAQPWLVRVSRAQGKVVEHRWRKWVAQCASLAGVHTVSRT